MSKPNQTPKTMVCTQHMKPVSQGGLGKTERQSRFKLDQFSLLKSGQRRKICKTCQTRLSKEWTDKRADYRKLYQQARAINAATGKQTVRVPNAKTFKSGDVLRYTVGGRPYKMATT